MVCGVGINDLHWCSDKNICGLYESRVYDTWKLMLHRCYLESSLKAHPTYRGCTVDKRWFRLSVFAEDIKLLPNYEYWRDNPNKKIALNKEHYVSGNKVYNRVLCGFDDISVNNYESNKRNQQWRKATSTPGRCNRKGKAVECIWLNYPGVTIWFDSAAEAGRSLGIDPSYINKKCRVGGGVVKDWRVKYGYRPV